MRLRHTNDDDNDDDDDDDNDDNDDDDDDDYDDNNDDDDNDDNDNDDNNDDNHDDSGYKCSLTYNPTTIPTPKQNRARNIIWFNLPFSKNVSTNVGKCFLKLIDKHFPNNNKLHKIFYMNTVKVSYSYMPSLKSIINSHNKYILYNNTNPNQQNCNYYNKNLCPLFNKRLTSNIVYIAAITTDNLHSTSNEKRYIEISETPFKLRYANHVKSFNISKYKNDTELSKHGWKLKKLI
ncbi:phosphatidylinositol 4-phosphate 5-kinase-like [Hydra vulgaris]|uniref:Phosphatidylinositol 4-phosphate 5-kinase-like n=1 Tax=Hydra vulgaris TaxID=6087 RepID=A0ABM4DHZ7_HYDVU